jgi:hypothetical protein
LVRDVDRAHVWYNLAGAAFGLMLASKYMPHLLGLYAWFNVIYLKNAGPNSPRKPHYYGAMAAAFLIANFAVVLPPTWQYCIDYLRGHHLTHHGFFYSGRLYVTDTPISPAGVPATYYLEMIATKVSLPVLVTAAAGIVPLIRQRKKRGFVWLGVLLFVQLLGYSVVAPKFQRYGLSMLVLIDILAAIGVVTAIEWIAAARLNVAARRLVAAASVLLIVASPLKAAVAARPFYSLNQNAIGVRVARPATVFPEEAYDFGVREAAAEIVRHAASHAEVISDATGVVSHYLARAGRRDLRVTSLSQSGLGGRGDRWVIVQDAHIYFENSKPVAQIRSDHTAWREYRLRDTLVLQLYHLPAQLESDDRAASGAKAPAPAVASS